MDSDRGENDDETYQNSRREVKKILGNRHEEIQISDSEHIGHFIEYIAEQKDRRKAVEIRFKGAHKRTKGRASPCQACQHQRSPEAHLQDCRNIPPVH
jgi:hypothetical protein